MRVRVAVHVAQGEVYRVETTDPAQELDVIVVDYDKAALPEREVEDFPTHNIPSNGSEAVVSRWPSNWTPQMDADDEELFNALFGEGSEG